ncbi:histone deacetylase family protein [Tautonia plasticadhaerens]|uniref:Histone deacetylase-like amidohydrolase n=1 Tax=Tautonia plasticadhaerens TaxID=2527974 RepID=A0A518GVR5_9BACT|nr:histone deacetylase [Tautonia plasticadhaerens]QDV32693.1 Histone deacetylase-like amidohydrolase [Tautonia plasticadhaerens]
MVMVRLSSDSRMLDHAPPIGHPESPERLATVIRHLERTSLRDACPSGTVREATDEELFRVHDVGYVDSLSRFESVGGGRIESDTWLGPGSLLAARLAAGAAIEAVSAVIDGPQKVAFCAVRPPGHHARPAAAMGFCLFGTVAAAASHAIESRGLGRVLVVDWDVHHGNGTQEMFYADGRVAFLSLHRHPFYPGTGMKDETGTGRGLGWTRNLPTSYGTPRREILDRFVSELNELADVTRPELVLISAGFDAHANDPVGDLGLETEDFETLTHAVQEVADTHAGGRIVSVLEGGYHPATLSQCVEAHLRALGADTP